MAPVEWMIRGPKVAGCNCAYACPCEFNAPPTDPNLCEGLEAMEIEEGYRGDTRLDGLRFAAIYRWPGPVHAGGGIVQGVIDARADAAQRAALLAILAGEDQAPSSPFVIYGATIAEEIAPAFVPIDFACNLAAGTGHFSAADLFSCTVEPIRNPVTGAIFRAALNLHDGFEFKGAEVGAATFRGEGALSMHHDRRYGFLTHVAYGPAGLIAERSYPRARGWLS